MTSRTYIDDAGDTQWLIYCDLCEVLTDQKDKPLTEYYGDGLCLGCVQEAARRGHDDDLLEQLQLRLRSNPR